MTSSPIALAADVGGTKTIFAAVHSDGSLSDRTSLPTTRDAGWIVEQCAAYTDGWNRNVPFGVAAAGVITPAGSVTFGGFIPWDGFPLQDRLEDRLGRRVIVRNDVTAAAWGEYLHAPALQSLVVIAAGTGVGGGAVVNGRLVIGADGAAMEVAHVPVSSGTAVCVCGHVGCLETVASGTWIARRYQDRLQSAGIDRDVTAVDVVTDARAGSLMARDVLTGAGDALGEVAAVIASLMDPERIVLTGGFARGAGSLVLDAASASFVRHVRPRPKPAGRIVLSALPDATTAALVGAGFQALGQQALEPSKVMLDAATP